MTACTVDEVIDRVRQYLSGTLSLPGLTVWVDRQEWEEDFGGSPAGQALGAVELAIHEFTDGTLTESELRSELEALLEGMPATFRLLPLTLEASGSAPIMADFLEQVVILGEAVAPRFGFESIQRELVPL